MNAASGSLDKVVALLAFLQSVLLDQSSRGSNVLRNATRVSMSSFLAGRAGIDGASIAEQINFLDVGRAYEGTTGSGAIHSHVWSHAVLKTGGGVLMIQLGGHKLSGNIDGKLKVTASGRILGVILDRVSVLLYKTYATLGMPTRSD